MALCLHLKYSTEMSLSRNHDPVPHRYWCQVSYLRWWPQFLTVMTSATSKQELFIAPWTWSLQGHRLHRWRNVTCSSVPVSVVWLLIAVQRGALSTLPSCHTVTNTKGHLITQRAPLREAEHGSGIKEQRSSVNTELMRVHEIGFR